MSPRLVKVILNFVLKMTLLPNRVLKNFTDAGLLKKKTENKNVS